jgi:hypothetical protein
MAAVVLAVFDACCYLLRIVLVVAPMAFVNGEPEVSLRGVSLRVCLCQH